MLHASDAQVLHKCVRHEVQKRRAEKLRFSMPLLPWRKPLRMLNRLHKSGTSSDWSNNVRIHVHICHLTSPTHWLTQWACISPDLPSMLLQLKLTFLPHYKPHPHWDAVRQVTPTYRSWTMIPQLLHLLTFCHNINQSVHLSLLLSQTRNGVLHVTMVLPGH